MVDWLPVHQYQQQLQHLTENRNRKQQIFMSLVEQQQSTQFIDHVEIQHRLSVILASLQQESEETRKHYSIKVLELEKEIYRKDSMLNEMARKLDVTVKKFQQLQWKILEKDNKIEDLQSKIKNFQSIFKDKVSNFLEKLDLSETSEGKVEYQSSQTSKRINISEYFIKSIQNSKPSMNANTSTSVQRKDSQKEDIKSTKIDNEDCSIQSELKFSPPLCCLKTESDPADKVYQRTKDKNPRRANGRSNIEGKQNKEQAEKEDEFITSAFQHNQKKNIQEVSAYSKRQSQGDSKCKQRGTAKRLELMEQRWKQISAFEQRVRKNSNTETR